MKINLMIIINLRTKIDKNHKKVKLIKTKNKNKSSKKINKKIMIKKMIV